MIRELHLNNRNPVLIVLYRLRRWLETYFTSCKKCHYTTPLKNTTFDFNNVLVNVEITTTKKCSRSIIHCWI